MVSAHLIYSLERHGSKARYNAILTWLKCFWPSRATALHIFHRDYNTTSLYYLDMCSFLILQASKVLGYLSSLVDFMERLVASKLRILLRLPSRILKCTCWYATSQYRNNLLHGTFCKYVSVHEPYSSTSARSFKLA